ncbi:MAG: hypothetical protein ISQ08_10895 [Planctomycetes bacterium]|nr:hypothetical protein [Planctomycetota bacterium]
MTRGLILAALGALAVGCGRAPGSEEAAAGSPDAAAGGAAAAPRQASSPAREEVGEGAASADAAERAALLASLDRARQEAEDARAEAVLLRSQVSELQAERSAAEAEALRLAEELARRDALLLQRQQELVAIAELAALAGEEELSFETLAQLDPDAAVRSLQGPELTQPGPDPAVERAEGMVPVLQGLLLAEGVRGWQVVTLGRLGTRAAGPVVLRVLDERGRPAGLVAAERLRLEASRAGRTVTLVLEEGREERVGVSLPFEGALSVEASGAHLRGGVRRIEVTGVAVEPWLEALPELFREQDLRPALDDGLWDLVAVRQELNRLLAEQEATGRWRLGGLGGVVGTELRDVQLVELDAEGRPARRLFADRLVLESNPAGGLRLRLHDGVQHRGQEQTPFLEGRFTIALPRADAAAWRSVGLPGMELEESSLRRAPGAPEGSAGGPSGEAGGAILPDRG